MSNTTAIRSDRSEPYHWASMPDQADPTLSDLATGADELAIPLKACRDVLDMIGDGGYLRSLAIALVALVDKADSERERLSEHLYRFSRSERTTEGSHGIQGQP